jgi:hypothetical protein
MASRAGQKGTLGLIIPEEDMPFTSDGVRPDLIINPHALPSRMTIGQLVECLFGKACLLYGAYGDCTAFATKGANYDTYGSMLTKMGYHNSGNQLLYNGYTGEQLYSEIFIGPTYYMRLKHMVKDKINYRATGKRNFLTRQTNQGRANDGGLKIGEMERDGIMANGLSYFLNESYMVRGDQYYMGICNKTGAIAIYNPDTNLFLSPFADGPIVFTKNIEGQQVLNAISKYGRSFSIVRIPFALKLLIQELQVMNIQMRIITEDNIDQLMNLSYQSRNIDKLLYVDHGENGMIERSVKEIVENYKKEIDYLGVKHATVRMSQYNPQEIVEPRSLEYTPEVPKQYEQENSDQETEYYRDSVSSEYKPDSNLSPGYIPKEGFDVNELLINKNPDKNQDDSSPPWAPPFDNQHKNDIFYSLPKYVQDNIVHTVSNDENILWDAVDAAHKKIVYEKHGIMIQTPDFSPPQGRTPEDDLIEGGAKIFEDSFLNEQFNKLGGSYQSQILQLPADQRPDIMRAIIRKSQTGGALNLTTQPTSDPLNNAFKALPLDKQFVALQGGYNSMAKEFNNLAKTVPDTFVKINKPISISEELANKYPLLAVDKTEDKTNIDQSSSNNNDNSSSEENNSGGSEIKKIIKI